MAITVLLEAKAEPGTGSDFLEILKEILPDTRSHDGCKKITVYQNQDDGDVVEFVGKWEGKEKYEKYHGWRQERGDMEILAGPLASEPGIRYFNLTDA